MNKNKLLVLIFSFLIHSVTFGKQFFVSTSGSANSDGSLRKPWTLQMALTHPKIVHPGDTINIAAGIYKGNFISNINGSSDQVIIVRNMPGERVVIDGNRKDSLIKNITTLILKGSFTWYIGLEITNSDPSRTIAIKGSNPKERRGEGVNVFGKRIKVINFIIHDTGQGIGAWKSAENSEYYGNVIYNNGWIAPDRLHGHGVYSQNSTGTMEYIDNVIFNNLGYGWHIYGSKKAPLNNYYLEGNVCFNDQWLVGGEGPLHNIMVNTNFSYNTFVQLGYGPADNYNLQLINNYFPAGLGLFWWKNVTATGNTIFNGSKLSSPINLRFSGKPDLKTFHFDNNHYYWTNLPSGKQLSFLWTNTTVNKKDPNRNGSFSLAAWRKSGQDRKSLLQYFPAKNPSNMALKGTKVVVRKNKYDPSRVMIIVYNWDHQDLVSVDLNGFLAKGEKYELHNVEDYFGAVVKGQFKGGKFDLPMEGHSVAKPLGFEKEMGPNTFPEFGTFILIKGVR